VPTQTGENWRFPHGMANAITAGASDLAMVDIMKIGGVTGWMAAMAQAEAWRCLYQTTLLSSRARM
jgi:mandelate racemase